MTSVIRTLIFALCLMPSYALAVDYPNLPGGLNQLFEYNGNTLPTDTTPSVVGMTLGYGYKFFSGHSITTDGTAPVDASSVYTHTFPAGMASGNTNGQINFWNSVKPFSSVSEYYEAVWFKLNGTDWEGPGLGQWKALGYWGMAIPSGGFSGTLYNVITPQGGTTNANGNVVASSWTLGIDRQGTDQPPWRIDSGTILNNKWYRMEIHIIMNSTTVSNGTLEVWLTNITDAGSPIKVISSTNRQFRNPSNPDGVWLRHHDPVWGGATGFTKLRNDSISFARFSAFGNTSVVTPPPTDSQPPSAPTCALIGGIC